MRILLAEPTRIGRAIVASMLREEGYTVVPCETAEAALEMLKGSEPFDVLITSIEFAAMSGLELCWEARLVADSGNPLYVIVLSSSRDEQKLVEALDSGADDFINKPPNRNELMARLRAAARLLQAQRELIRLACFDSLTGLRNRRSYFEELDKLVDYPGPIAVIMLDIDYFKQVNDRHGHDAGDDVLKEIGTRLTAMDRNFARLGGEEFAVVVRGPIAVAAQMAEMIRQNVAAMPVETRNGAIPVTISLGVAERTPGSRFDLAMKDADIALYASKSAGRNRVTVSRSASSMGGNELLHEFYGT